VQCYGLSVSSTIANLGENTLLSSVRDQSGFVSHIQIDVILGLQPTYRLCRLKSSVPATEEPELHPTFADMIEGAYLFIAIGAALVTGILYGLTRFFGWPFMFPVYSPCYQDL
jgi:hypothetical protein